jgi:hypothetical protein
MGVVRPPRMAKPLNFFEGLALRGDQTTPRQNGVAGHPYGVVRQPLSFF